MLKVLIADNESIIRNGIKLILEEGQIEVVAMASNGREAFELCRTLSVDLVLMDLMMPECNGIEATRLIKNFNSEIKVLILTTFYDEESIQDALKNGADGYLLKDIDPQELISTIKSTIKGLRIVHENVYEAVLKKFDNISAKNQANKNSQKDIFNENEIKIIQLVVQGKTNKNIGQALNLSEGRIRNIITEILATLNLKDRTQLAVYAVKNNII